MAVIYIALGVEGFGCVDTEEMHVGAMLPFNEPKVNQVQGKEPCLPIHTVGKEVLIDLER